MSFTNSSLILTALENEIDVGDDFVCDCSSLPQLPPTAAADAHVLLLRTTLRNVMHRARAFGEFLEWGIFSYSDELLNNIQIVLLTEESLKDRA